MRSLLLMFIMVVLIADLDGQTGEWEFLRGEDGIEVFSRKSADSPIKEIRVQNMMKTDLSSLVALMKDVDNHKNWTYANKKAEVIERQNEFAWVFYGYSNAPWPVQDRDMVINAHLSQDPKTKVVTNEGNCNPELLPEKDGVVRVPECRSVWTLEPVGSDSVLVTLEIKMNLGGSLPAWLINMVSHRGPFETLKNMEEEVRKPKYLNAELDYIID